MENKEYEYLNLLERCLDPIQKESCCAKGNTVVAAGAGSGKTQVLATRFAWLVMSEGVPASEILTLTFTKKAAGEMYQRIYETLFFFANNEKTPDLERKRAKQALQDFAEVHIQTLDSYCAGIVKQAANIYGIRPDFTSGSSDSEQDIKNLALPFVFKNRENPGIKTFAKPGQFQEFAETVIAKAISKHTSLISPDNFFSSQITKQFEMIINAWNFLICGEGQMPEELKSQFEAFSETAAKKNFTVSTNLKKLTSDLFSLAQSLESTASGAFYTKVQIRFEEAKKYSDSLDIKLKTTDDFETEQTRNAIKSMEKILELLNFSQGGSLSEPLATLRSTLMYLRDNLAPLISSLFVFIQQYKSIIELYSLLDTFLAQVNHSKRTSGNLTFKDVSELALVILTNDEQIRLQEQNSFSQIMIDEFQDNNSKNRDMLFLLCGNKEKLFFVGDEKQSIYKFRGAEVDVFNELKNHETIKQTSPMTYNYRSSLEMITAFNRMFEGEKSIFDNQNEVSFEARYLTKAFKYSPADKKVLDAPALTQDTVPIHTILLNNSLIKDNDEYLNEKDQKAWFIANKINSMLKENKTLKYSDIAVLEYRRTDRSYLTKWFNYFNIPYNLDSNNAIFADGPVNDIYNYLKLCVYPSDLTALAAYLSSPFYGNDINKTVNYVLQTESYHLPDQKEILSQSITKTIQSLWQYTGYYYETLLNKNAAQYAENFDLLFELARQSDLEGKNISWFVDQLSIIKDKETNNSSFEEEINISDISYPLEKEDSVQIMTVHKSKGLQFKEVFLSGCIGIRNGSDKDNFFYDDITGTSFASTKKDNYFFQIQKELAKKKTIAELRRVLYVGITRAINSVYIIGNWTQVVTNSSKSDDSMKLIEKQIRWYYPRTEKEETFGLDNIEFNPEAPFTFEQIPPMKKEDAYSNLKKEDLSSRIKEVAELYNKKAEIVFEYPVSNRKTPSSLEPEYNPAASEDSDSGAKYEQSEDTLTSAQFTAADFGTLVHSYLEMQANGIEAEAYVPEAKLVKGLKEADKEKTLKTCISMAKEFRQQPIGQKLEEAKKQGRFYKAEWAFRMFHDGSIFTGSIDLIFQNPDSDDTYTIVDYKSDNEINVEKYKGQQNCYRVAASKLLGIPEEKIECVLYFLKHKALCKVFE